MGTNGQPRLRVALAGATGLVGQELLAIAAGDTELQVELGLFASAESAGKRLSYRGQELAVEDLAACDFSQFNAALFCIGDDLSARYVPQALDAGCLVVDKSNAFRLDPAVPLVVAGVNDAALSSATRLVANPNCSTIILAHTLAPLALAYGLRRVWVATYQSVSGAGSRGVETLLQGLENADLGAALIPRPALQADGYAHNVIPAIGRLDETGHCSEEAKLVNETRKVFGQPGLPIVAHAVRVPVLIGHSLAVTVELAAGGTAKDIEALWRDAPDVRWLDAELPTPVSAMRHPLVEVGRFRREQELEDGWSFFASGDNLTLGAALNGWRILKQLVARAGQSAPATAGAGRYGN